MRNPTAVRRLNLWQQNQAAMSVSPDDPQGHTPAAKGKRCWAWGLDCVADDSALRPRAARPRSLWLRVSCRADQSHLETSVRHAAPAVDAERSRVWWGQSGAASGPCPGARPEDREVQRFAVASKTLDISSLTTPLANPGPPRLATPGGVLQHLKVTR